MTQVITSLPFVGVPWTQYRLENSLQYSSSTGTAIRLPHYSSLDWNGCQIYGPSDKASSNIGLDIADQETVAVYGHGGVAQFSIGIYAGASGLGSGLRMRDTIARHCWFRGFLVRSNGFVLENLLAANIGGTTRPDLQQSHIFGFEYLGSGLVRNCRAIDVFNNNVGMEAAGHSVSEFARPITLRECLAQNPQVRSHSIGYWFGSEDSRVVVEDCVAINQETGFWWKHVTTGTKGALRGNLTDNCTTKYLFNPAAVTDHGDNV